MEELLYYNAAAIATDGAFAKLARLRAKHGSWRKAFERCRSDRPKPDPAAAWKRLAALGITLVAADDGRYPALLREIPDPPLALYVRGTLPPGDRPAIAIVGTRRGTPQGRDAARRFARDLAGAGFPIASGLALGIDAAAHEGCLDAEGAAVAVLAGGLEEIYPRENEALGARILARGGAIISEYPPGSPPYGPRFLERNRIVSGISCGVLIVEAPRGSGSLATARHAMEQNRDLFVVPGPITHANFEGSHELIRQGAELVTAPREILDAYGAAREDALAAAQGASNWRETLILHALAAIGGAADVDKIISATTLEPRVVNEALSFLLLRGLIKEEGGGYTIER